MFQKTSCLPGVQPWALRFVQEVPELWDANLLHGVAGTFKCLLQGLVGTALAQPLQEPLLAVRHVKKVLSVSWDQDEAELRCRLQVRNVSVEKSCRVELWQTDRRPAFTLSEGGGGANEVKDQVQVYVVQGLVLFPHQSDQAVPRQQDREHKVFGFGSLQARRDHVPGRAAQRQAGDCAEQETGVSVQPMQQVVGEILRAGKQATQVIVLLVLEDVVELGEGKQADDLVVNVLQLPQELLVWLTGSRHAHQDQRTLGKENHFTAIWHTQNVYRVYMDSSYFIKLIFDLFLFYLWPTSKSHSVFWPAWMERMMFFSASTKDTRAIITPMVLDRASSVP